MSINDGTALQRNVSSHNSFGKNVTIKLATTAVLAAVGLVLSYLNPFGYFFIFGTKINPFAHLINSIAGVLLGPVYAVICATIIATLRFSFSIGSIFAFPGGIPGALAVGLVRFFFVKKNLSIVHYAGLFEPLGTIFIGGTISAAMSILLPSLNTISLFTLWWLFALSCIPGAILGWFILLVIKKTRFYVYFMPESIEV
jgi:energy coupling factor transporter S component ThiW